VKTTFKIIGIVILAFIASIFLFSVYHNLASKLFFVADEIVVFVMLTFFLVLFWAHFFKDKSIQGTFFQSVTHKKTFAVLMVLYTLLFIITFIDRFNYQQQTFSKDNTSLFLPGNVYENTQYHFNLTYPEGSTFAHATPEAGFVTRFFLPNRQTLEGDQENIGVHVDENSFDLDAVIAQRQDAFSKNGSIDVKEVQFGGQKGYLMIFTSDYTVQKGTKELSYLTVKDGILFELNYFPVVDQSLSIIDGVADSFKFTK